VFEKGLAEERNFVVSEKKRFSNSCVEAFLPVLSVLVGE
jgi:hypothetical protein